jgi:hypothetical protein
MKNDLGGKGRKGEKAYARKGGVECLIDVCGWCNTLSRDRGLIEGRVEFWDSSF